jgi:SAM-dependent methyltransferase
MTTQDEWQGRVGQNWARSHDRTDRAFRGITAALMAAVADLPGEVICDIGCGAGELSLALAAARPAAQVTGVDISADLIAAARDRAGANDRCTFAECDVLDWQPTLAPDLLVSRHGVMFFDDPVATFAHLRAIATPRAHIAFSCFRDLADNPWATEPSAALGLPFVLADGYAPGPFAFRDQGFTRAVLEQAGWREVDFARCDTAFVAGEGADAVEQAVGFFSRIGPAAAVLAAMDADTQAATRAALRARLASLDADGRVGPAASVWIVTARA